MAEFICEICKKNGVEIKKRNLVPHIQKKHPEINGNTKTYMQMFPGAKLREAPSTSYSNPEHMKSCVEKSIQTRTGKSLSDEHKQKIGSSNKISEKYKESRRILSEQYKSGEKTHHNKLIVDKDMLEKMYVEERKSISAISLETGITRRIISNYIDIYGIDKRSKSLSVTISRNSGYSYRKLSDSERNVIIGELLGDGSFTNEKQSCGLAYRHSCKYEENLIWIKSLLRNIDWAKIIYRKNKENIYFYLRSKNHPDFKEIYDDFYYDLNGKRKKRIPKNLQINGTVLLHWFLGDGCASSYVNKNGKTCNSIEIAACGFNIDDLYRIVLPQLNLMGIKCKIKDKKSGPVIIVYRESYERFYEVIGDCPVDCYKYKFKFAPKRANEKKTFKDVNEAFDYYRDNGFPFLSITQDNKIEILNALKKKNYSDINHVLHDTKMGLKLANIYHSHRYEVVSYGRKRSAMETFLNDGSLKKILENIMKKNGIIDNNMVRNRCSLWSNTTPFNFKPLTAKFIIKKYSKIGGVVLDPCSGYGGRMLGCIAAQNRFYIGVEPEIDTIVGLNRMAKDLSFKDYHIYNDYFENFNYDLNKKIDLIFTCPPYYDMELYNPSNKNQSHVKYKNYEEWKEGFLETLIKKSYRLLDNGGHFVIVTDNNKRNKIADDFFEIACKYFTFEEFYFMEYNKNRFAENDIKIKYEPVFVFRK